MCAGGSYTEGWPATVKRYNTMVRDFQSDDQGKNVMTADGDMVGTVESASGSTAHIKADENLSRSIRRRLGWTEEGEETYALDKSNVDQISGDEIHLKQKL